MISKHISDKEGVYSNTAIRRGIDNTPNDEQLANMKLIATKVFEPLRTYVNGPIKINSFFRSVELKKHMDFDQLIWEFGDNKNPNWIHVSYVSSKENRNRCLLAYKENKKTKYKVI